MSNRWLKHKASKMQSFHDYDPAVTVYLFNIGRRKGLKHWELWQGFITLHSQLECCDTYGSVTSAKQGLLIDAKMIYDTKVKTAAGLDLKEGQAYCKAHDNIYTIGRGCIVCNRSTQGHFDFDDAQPICTNCGYVQCQCPDLDHEVIESKVTKTYHKKEKRPVTDKIKTRELNCALWFIDKMTDLDRAEKVFKAALAAARALEEP